MSFLAKQAHSTNIQAIEQDNCVHYCIERVTELYSTIQHWRIILSLIIIFPFHVQIERLKIIRQNSIIIIIFLTLLDYVDK